MTRILSQHDARTVGNPGFRHLSPPGSFSGKKSDIRVVKRNIPASGINQEENWSTTEDIVGDPSPRILSGSMRPGARNKSTSDERTRVPDNSANRKITIR